MQSEHDVWNTPDVHRAICRRIGGSLSAGYDLSKPLPDRMQGLLNQLDEPSAEGETKRGQPLLPHPPAGSRAQCLGSGQPSPPIKPPGRP
jgi:hypothetical protein